MATNRLRIEEILSRAECAAIDAFGRGWQSGGNLPALAAFLHEKLGAEMILDPGIVAGFAADSSNLPGRAEALCRPKSERECAAVFRACFAAGLPVTVSGGRSNLTGSATPEGGVLVSTVNMLGPEVSVDAAARTAVCSPGMIVEEFRRRVLDLSGGELCFPVDPTSRSDASMGGAVACNCSGFTPGETGAIRHWIGSLRLLLPDGRLIRARRGEFVSADGAFLLDDRRWPMPRHRRPAIKNAAGPYSAPDGVMDFVDLVVGSEGIFGLVSGCNVRLAKRPPEFLDIFFSLPGEREALRFLEAVYGRSVGNISNLGALEYFGANCRRFMKHEERFFDGPAAVGIYVQEPVFDGNVVEAAEAWLNLLQFSGLKVGDDAMKLLDTARLRELFMEARHSMPANAVEVAQSRGTFTIMTDTVVPLERFAEFLDFSHGLLRSERLEYLSFGHLGDCHLHFTILPERGRVDAAVAAYDAIVARSAELGGVYSGEHGTGKRKRKDFLRCYGPEAAEGIRACKAAVDPELLFCRGNVFVS